MKTSLKKLQKFAALWHDRRPPKRHQSMALDDLDRASQNLNDMRDCYDRLLSAAAATANSVHEFSESLREMGDCLLEKTALNDDEESGKVLLMLGKVQFELQKLVDGYRCHIFRTIAIPSESLLNELRIVEEMKKRCYGKREIYEDLLNKQKEKGRLRNCKGESFPWPPLEEAQDEYDEEANVFVFRMKSLQQGQSRSFLTQASRHHAAQMYFFKKAVRSLEAIEPHVRLLAEKQHIDYQLSGLKDDEHGIYDNNESDGTDDSSDKSFDYGENGPVQEVSMEENLPIPGRNSFLFQRGFRAISKSAPLFPEKKLDSAEQLLRLGPSLSRKFTSYVLPTPDETRGPVSRKLYNQAPLQTRQTDWNLHHSSPLDQKRYEELGANDKFSGPMILDTRSVLKESNNTPKPNPLPLQFSKLDPDVASYAKKAKRQAFSGALTGMPSPNVTVSGPIFSSLPYFGSLLHTSSPRPKSNPKLSSLASPTFVSSPKISELHELPRPPDNIIARRTSNCGAHSGPLISKTHNLSMTSAAASTLPVPLSPMALSRSYSIPTGGLDVELRVPYQNSEKTEDISSPPLTPISLLNVQPAIQPFK